MPTQFNDAVTITGSLAVPGGIATKFDRAQLNQEPFVPHAVPFDRFRVHDAMQTNLPGTAAADDLAVIAATFGADAPTLQTSDAKATTVTQRARCLFMIPAEYDDGETVSVRIAAAMNVTISDGTATVDVECYKADRQGSVGSDLCTTAAQSINSLTFANKDFTITSATLAPGDVLDIRITVAVTDTATGTAVIGELGAVELLLDIRG